MNMPHKQFEIVSFENRQHLQLNFKDKALVLMSIWGPQQRLWVSLVDHKHVQMYLKDRERDVKVPGQKAQSDEGWVISLAFYFCVFGLLPI